jgi:hypothetical protein
MADTNRTSGSTAWDKSAGNADAGSADADNVEAGDVETGTAVADAPDLGQEQVRTPPVIETDPLLVHVGESIDEAKEAAREVFGEHGSGSEDDVDPNLGLGAPVP